MAGASKPDDVSTKQQRIAELAKQYPEMGFTSLAHHMDIVWLVQAFAAPAKTGPWAWTGKRQRTMRSNVGQPPVSAGPSQVRHVPGTAGAASAYTERDGWRHPAHRDPDF